MALQGFCAGEPQNRDVTDVLYRKYPQKGPNLGLPRMLIFWFTFISIEIKLHLVSMGTPFFFLLFYARLGILKQYCTFHGPKSGQNGAGQTDAQRERRTDAHQKFEASYTKALKGKYSLDQTSTPQRNRHAKFISKT